ncbi:MAG: hypothetical protein J6P77_03605 [Acetobacter sp.]|nr:hypothetical protein [Acetobacter sp.]
MPLSSSLNALVIFCLVFMPGIVWNFIALKIYPRSRSYPNASIFIIQSIILTVITYCIEFIGYSLICCLSFYLLHYTLPPISPDDLLLQNFSGPEFIFEIVAIFLAVVLAVIYLFLWKRYFKIDPLIFFLRKFKLTHEFSGLDVWDDSIVEHQETEDKSGTKGAWVRVFDFEDKTICEGRIRVCSHLLNETKGIIELELHEATLYDCSESGDFYNNNYKNKVITENSILYVSKSRESVIIELLKEKEK